MRRLRIGSFNLPFLIGDAGFVIDPMSLDLWKDAVLNLMEDSGLYLECSSRAKEISKLYNTEEQYTKFHEMVLKCLGD